jgi:hypothetical protein
MTASEWYCDIELPNIPTPGDDSVVTEILSANAEIFDWASVRNDLRGVGVAAETEASGIGRAPTQLSHSKVRRRVHE